MQLILLCCLYYTRCQLFDTQTEFVTDDHLLKKPTLTISIVHQDDSKQQHHLPFTGGKNHCSFLLVHRQLPLQYVQYHTGKNYVVLILQVFSANISEFIPGNHSFRYLSLFLVFFGGGGVGWGGVESAKTHRVYILSTELSRATRNQMKPFFCKALSWQPHGLAYNPKTLMVLCYVGSLGCLIPSACMNTDPGICLQGVLALCHPAQTCCIWQ